MCTKCVVIATKLATLNEPDIFSKAISAFSELKHALKLNTAAATVAAVACHCHGVHIKFSFQFMSNCAKEL